MRITWRRSISGLMLAMIGLVSFTSCSEDFPGNVESDKFTDLKSIRIVNAGPAGNEVLVGQIDEKSKSITFPRIDTLSDFSKIQFEAVTSDGAQLEKNVFTIPYQRGDTHKDIILKVTNNPRFKEYMATIRFKVPVYGANIEQPTFYDYSLNPLGNPIYPSFNTADTRGSGFDGKHVLVIDRGAAGAHLLEVAKLKNNVVERIPLNMTGVTGGTFAINMGAQVNGHSYIANLSGGLTSPLKIYHWSNPSQVPDLVINVDVSKIAGASVRHGDTFSINLDNNGNGFAYFLSANASIIRIKISNYTLGSEPTVITSKINYEQWGHFSQIGGTESYILSGHSQPLSLVNNSGSASYTLNAKSLPRSMSDVKIFTFNGTRYLLGITVPRNAPTNGSTLYLYNINKGESIGDALTALEKTSEDDKVAPHVFSHVISTAVNASPGTQAGYYIVKDVDGKDQKLMIYGATTQGGFAIIEFGPAVAED